MPKKDRPMPKAMQVYLFKKRFGNLDTFTFEDYVDDTLTFPENLWNLMENHCDEILKARHETGYTEEEDAKIFGWDKKAAEQARALEDFWKEVQKYEWEIEKEEPDLHEGEIEPEEVGGWNVEKTNEGEIHTIEVKIEPHKVISKGKSYLYGRIQLNVDQRWIELMAKISVNIPEELL